MEERIADMKFFRTYIMERKREFMISLLFGIIFVVSFLLYHLPMKALLYPVLLCFLLGVVLSIWDYGKVRKRHLQLLEIKNLTAEMISQLPVADSIAEDDYQQIIYSLQNEIAKLKMHTSARYQDMVDYYTLWVHQIKTPIASMRLQLQNEDTVFSRKLSSDLLRIEQYVEMVLAFLRLDSDFHDYIFREHNIDTIMKQAIKKFAAEFIARKIQLIYEPIDRTIITDDKWLCLVVEQILSNALKYTREGSIKIYCEGNTLCIEDTGIGIAPEDLPRIFEKGYTGYNGHNDKKASGIGLYLCRRICENLSMKIHAISEPDKGTTIRIGLEQYHLKVE